MRKIKIAILCVGNICRSPVGEYLLREYAKKSENKTIQSIFFDSAGLHGGFLELARDSKEYLEERGIDPSDFKSKGISRNYLDQFDNIWVMAKWHKKFIIDHYYAELPRKERGKIKSKMKTLIEVSGEGSGDVIDPYGLRTEEYLEILYQIDRLSKKIIEQLKF